MRGGRSATLHCSQLIYLGWMNAELILCFGRGGDCRKQRRGDLPGVRAAAGAQPDGLHQRWYPPDGGWCGTRLTECRLADKQVAAKSCEQGCA